MKVFKASLLVIKHHYVSYIVNFMIFIGLAVVISSLTANEFDPTFTEIAPSVAIINRDIESHLIEGLTTFMDENANIVELDDNRNALQDAIFYNATNLIVIIPDGFNDSFIAGNPMTLEIVTSNQIARAFIAENLIEQYMNMARMHFAVDSGLSEEAIVSAVLQDLKLEASVEKMFFGIAAPIDGIYMFYTGMMNYILLILCFLSVTNLTLVFKRTDIRRRNLCAPISLRSFSMQQMLASAAMSFAGWILTVALGLIMYGSNLGGVDPRVIGLMILNTFVLMIFALALASLMSAFVSNRNAQNAVANIMTMALCFLGGVFVPLEVMGDGIVAVSRFLPTYWNMTALTRIGALTALDAYSLAPVWQAIGVQLAFAAAIFAITLLVSKHVGQSERFASSIRTEVEA